MIQEATPLKKVAPEPIPQPGSPLRNSIEANNEDNTVEAKKDIEAPTSSPTAAAPAVKDDKLDDIEGDCDSDSEEDIVIHEVHQATAPQAINRARIVQVAKPVAPMLPPRNPFRNSHNRNSATSDASTERAADDKPSPVSTPSLRHGDSNSSLSSVDGDGLAHVSVSLQPKQQTGEQQTVEQQNDEQNKNETPLPRPDSPVKNVPGAF